MSCHCHHSHIHKHGDENSPHSSDMQKLLGVSLLNISITIVQIIGGVLSNSLALLSDAIHNLGDSSAIFLAYIAAKISGKQPNKRYTFGYKRAEILAALFNAVVLIAICIYLIFEAIERFTTPRPIHGKVMLIVACFGLLVNLVSVIVLNKGRHTNLNVKAAYLHLLGDTLSSVAVIGGGVAIWLFEILWLDPLITILVSIYIIYHTQSLLKDTVDILMQTVPSNIDIADIKTMVEEIEGVDNIHHVHIWCLVDKTTHLEAHINLKPRVTMEQMMVIKEQVEKLLNEKFNIRHITLQTGYNCCQGTTDLIINE